MDYSLTFSNGEGAAPGILGFLLTYFLVGDTKYCGWLLEWLVNKPTISPDKSTLSRLLQSPAFSLWKKYRCLVFFWCWTKSLDFCSWNPPRFLQVNLVPNTRSSHLRPPMGRRTAGRLSRSRGSGSSQCLKGWCSELERCLFEQENDGKEENHGNSVPL